MTRSCSHRPHGVGAVRRVWVPVLLCALPAAAAWAGPQPADSGSSSSSSASAEVVVSALDPIRLEREIVPQFVKTHAAPTPLIAQMTRWREAVCPEVAGVSPEVAATVTERILAAAQAAGAPSPGAGQKCGYISILFTNQPQQLVDSMEKEHATFLGSGRVKGDTTFSRAVQVWYLTGTLQLSVAALSPPPPAAPAIETPTSPEALRDEVLKPRNGVGPRDMVINYGASIPAAPPGKSYSKVPAPVPSPSVVPDPTWDDPALNIDGAPVGWAGTRLDQQLRSEVLHVTIVVDGQKLNGTPLEVLSDYIAFVALSRVTALDACNPLPSILDLFAADCADRAKPAALSAADAAFLQALYASELDGTIDKERPEVSRKMLEALKKQQR